jgi:hypothetical protein
VSRETIVSPWAKRRCRSDEIGLRIRVPGLAAVFDEQTPFEHHVFTDGEHTLLEYRPHSMSEPIVQFGAPRRIVNAFDAEADVGSSLARRNSERTFASSNHPVTDRHRARAIVRASHHCVFDNVKMVLASAREDG